MKRKKTEGSAGTPANAKARLCKPLLAAVCWGMLGVGVNIAEAGVVFEPPDLSNDLLTPTVLPGGTNQVVGYVVLATDNNDTFLFNDLGGAVGTIQINYSLVGSQIADYGLNINFYTSALTFFATAHIGVADPLVGSVLVNVPVDNKLVVQVVQVQDASGEGTDYAIGFDVAGRVPVPATGGLAALGAAVLFIRRRRESRRG